MFISAMALKQDNRDLQTQEAQFMEMFLNLSKGREEFKALLTVNRAKKSPEDNKDEWWEQLQAEVETMRTQMLGQRALTQGLARGQEVLRAIIKKLHQDGAAV